MRNGNRIVGKTLSILKERKREKVTKLAFETGISYKHFRYYVIPMLLDISGCVSFDRTSNELVWTCEETEIQQAVG